MVLKTVMVRPHPHRLRVVEVLADVPERLEVLVADARLSGHPEHGGLRHPHASLPRQGVVELTIPQVGETFLVRSPGSPCVLCR
jgi:hypothetical protein